MRRIDGKGLNMKVPYTTRLSPDTVRGIKHVVFENKMNGQQPTTEQALVEEALTEYLKIFNW